MVGRQHETYQTIVVCMAAAGARVVGLTKITQPIFYYSSTAVIPLPVRKFQRIALIVCKLSFTSVFRMAVQYLVTLAAIDE